jgi:hypothetical protein
MDTSGFFTDFVGLPTNVVLTRRITVGGLAELTTIRWRQVG